MPIIIETRNATFEITQPGNGYFELKKTVDKTPGKTAKAKEGSVWKGKTMIHPILGQPFILKDDGKEVAKTEPVLKISGKL